MESHEDLSAGSSDRRFVYLITFSALIGMSRAEVANQVQDAYSACNIGLSHYAVFSELHQNGKPHFHVAVRAQKQHFWAPIATYLREHGMSPHFSKPSSYAVAFKYCSQPSAKKGLADLDPEPLLSSDHPAAESLRQGERRTGAMRRPKRAAAEGGAASSGDPAPHGSMEEHPSKRSRPAEIYDIVLAKGFRSDIQLMAYAKTQKEEGNESVLQFCLTCASVSSFVERCWQIDGAQDAVAASAVSRVDRLRAAAFGACTCEGAWATCAADILRWNNVAPQEFCSSIYKALRDGAGKFRNVFIHGVRNCGKSFLLAPLGAIYGDRVFHKPGGAGQYRLVNLLTTDVILWNDWRFDSGIIAWETLLLLGEGASFNVPVPQNTAARGDAVYTRSAPLFITANQPMYHASRVEREMMDARFKFFELQYSIPQEQCQSVPACGRCFASFVLLHGNTDEIHMADGPLRDD
jgi:hypothetical protein